MPETPLLGYKMHLAVDQGPGLVRQAILTPVTEGRADAATFVIV